MVLTKSPNENSLMLKNRARVVLTASRRRLWALRTLLWSKGLGKVCLGLGQV